MPNLWEPFPFGIENTRAVWDGMTKSFGDLALLRQYGIPDRYVSAMVVAFTPQERMGGISNPIDRKAVVSALAPDTGLPLDPEPSERDVLVTLQLNDDGSPVLDSNNNLIQDELLKIVAPPTRRGPSRKELYWVLQVRA